MELIQAGVILSESDLGRRVKNSLGEFGTITVFNENMDGTSDFSITYLGEFTEKCMYTGHRQKTMKNYIVKTSCIGKTVDNASRKSEVICFI